MKHKRLKNYLKFGLLLFGINIALIGCQQDDFKSNELSLENESPFNMKIISNNEISNNLKVSEQLRKFDNINSSDGFQRRDVYNSEYDFTVNTDYSKYIESNDGNLHSYTFLIEREENNGLLENLVLTLQPDGTYLAEVIVYDFANDGTAEINTALLENFDTSQYLGRFSFTYSCTQTITYSISYNEDCTCQFLEIHDVQTNCTYQYYNTNSFTEGGSGGGGGGGWNNTVWTGGGSSSSGTGNTNGNTDTNTTTSPLFNLDEIKDKRKLNDITSNSVIKSKIDELFPKIFSDQSNNYEEDGARFKQINDSTYTVREPNFRGNYFVDYTPDYLEKEIVSVHIHQQKFYDLDVSTEPFINSPVFSDGDIAEFVKNVNFIENSDPDLADDVVSILLSEIGAFALVVKDKDKALDAHNALQNPQTKEDFEEDFHESVLKDWNEDNCDNACLTKNIARFINKYKINGQKLGISIYQASIINNEIVFWQKL